MNHKGRISKYGVIIILGFVVIMLFTIKHAYARRYIYLSRPKVGAGFNYGYSEEKRKDPYNTQKSSSDTSQEMLEIETNGWLYHPYLCEFSLGIRPVWTQQSSKSDAGTSSKSKTSYLGYNLSTTFFKAKPYTLRLFGSKSERRAQSTLVRESETRTDTYGASLNLKAKSFPTALNYKHTANTQSGFYNSEDELDSFLLSMSHGTKKSITNLESTYDDRTRTFDGTLNQIKNLKSEIRNVYYIKDDRKTRLKSDLYHRWSEQGSASTSSLRLSQNLRWVHRKNLSSSCRWGYSQSKTGANLTESMSAGAGLSHRLYENLGTNLSADASLNKFPTGETKTYIGNLNLNYNRRIPWGNLYLRTGHRYKITERSLTERYIEVLNESQVLGTGVVTLLDNKHAVIDSIQITDITGTIIYVNNVDYTVTALSSSVRISRTAFGSITENDTVLVNYRYLSNPFFDDSVYTESYGVGLKLWSFLNLFSNYRRSTQKILSGPPPDTLSNDWSRSSGANMQWTWRWTDTYLAYTQTTGSDISTDRLNARETLTFRPTRDLYIIIPLRYGKVTFKDRDESDEYYGLSPRIDRRLPGWGKLSLEAVWNSTLSTSQETVESGLVCTLNWFYRIFKGKIIYEYINQEEKLKDVVRTKHKLNFQIVRILW